MPDPMAGFHPMRTAPTDGTPVLLYIRHMNFRYARGDERKDWEQLCPAYWTDFNNGGWVWTGIAGQPIAWRFLVTEMLTGIFEDRARRNWFPKQVVTGIYFDG